jgi:hypothetical protein
MKSTSPYRIRFLLQPGRTLRPLELGQLYTDLLEIEPLNGAAIEPVGLLDCALVTAHDASGSIAGYACAQIVAVKGVGDVLHLDRTAVASGPSRTQLVERMSWRLLLGYLLRFGFLDRQWCTYTTMGSPRIAPTAGPERDLPTSCAIDEAVKRELPYELPALPPAWRRALEGAFHEVAAFESDREILQIGYVTLGSLLRSKLRHRLRLGARAPEALRTRRSW